MRDLLLSTLALFLLSSCGNKNENLFPSREDITESVYASGIIKSVNQYQVFSSVNGIIETIHVSEGDYIKQGQVLFTMRNEAGKLQTDQAEQQAQYSDYKNNEIKLNDLRLNIDLSRKKLIQDSLMLERQKVLWKQSIGSLLELEQRELSYKNSLNTYKSAILRYKDLEKQLVFNAKQAGKNLEISRQRVSDFQIRSAINGKVYQLSKKPGELVSVQMPVAVIGDSSRFIIELQVDAYDIARIKTGMSVYVSIDHYKDSVFEAKIQTISPIMNERSKTFTVEARFVRQPPILYPHITVEASILIKSKKDVLTIPRKYLQNDSFVVLSDGQQVQVQTGLKDYVKVEIISGITEKDALILPE